MKIVLELKPLDNNAFLVQDLKDQIIRYIKEKLENYKKIEFKVYRL